jgi:hypothetical protein
MNTSDAQSKTESSDSFSRKDAEMSPFGFAIQLETIRALARKIRGQTEGETHECAREIERLAGRLIESHEKQSHRLEEWARGIGPATPSPASYQKSSSA